MVSKFAATESDSDPMHRRDSNGTNPRPALHIALEPPAPIRPPTHIALPTPLDEGGGFDDRDELPTLVYEKPASQPPPAPSKADELSVVFRGARSTAQRPATIPPKGGVRSWKDLQQTAIRALLPPPAEPTIPRAPRTPGGFATPGPLPLPSRNPNALAVYQPAANDSLRPVFFSSGHLTLPPGGGGGFRLRLLSLLGAAAVGGGLLGAAFLWWQSSQRGELVIDIANEQCGAVEDVRIYVDDELRCTSSPCSVTVKRGGHVVRAEANGYPVSAPEAVLVDPDVPTLHKVQMGTSTKTGIEVRVSQKGHQLIVDGRPVGELPKRITGLAPGEHAVRIVDADGHTALERKVMLDDEQLVIIDASMLPSKQAEEEAQASDEAESRVSSSDKRGNNRQESTLGSRNSQRGTSPSDSEPSGERPSSASESASRRSAEDGDAERATSPRAESEGEEESSALSTLTQGTLNLSAEPSAVVVLDGQPLGKTPQSVRVAPGSHSLLFIHPEHGRSKATVSVKPGQTRNLKARF